MNVEKLKTSAVPAGVQWWHSREHECAACSGHRDFHVCDPRCTLCVLDRLKALVNAVGIMIRLLLLPRVGKNKRDVGCSPLEQIARSKP